MFVLIERLVVLLQFEKLHKPQRIMYMLPFLTMTSIIPTKHASWPKVTSLCLYKTPPKHVVGNSTRTQRWTHPYRFELMVCCGLGQSQQKPVYSPPPHQLTTCSLCTANISYSNYIMWEVFRSVAIQIISWPEAMASKPHIFITHTHKQNKL